MNDSIDQLLRSPVSFLADSGPEEDIALSSRIRLARNLAGRPFPAAASLESRQEVCELVSQAAAGSGVLGCPDCYRFDPAEMSPLDREILFERRLASRDFLERDGGTRLLVRSDESSSIMINEEDQLRIQTLRPGFQLDEVWRVINELDDELSSKLDYAFDDKLGYLTSCPTNVGTGMRASVMLHLPGLVLSGQIGPTIQGVSKLNLAVRGIFGEGTDNRGNLFQVSNQSTLGESETQIIERLNTVISQLIAQEKIARQQLILRDRFALLDHVGRSLRNSPARVPDHHGRGAQFALRSPDRRRSRNVQYGGHQAGERAVSRDQSGPPAEAGRQGAFRAGTGHLPRGALPGQAQRNLRRLTAGKFKRSDSSFSGSRSGCLAESSNCGSLLFLCFFGGFFSLWRRQFAYLCGSC
ncbi:MAG: hypothetical protein L6W00_18505 [Lentisphaeria bacterium]|nr:MAG: hypothetical protein L6W00_18505 [Lentisphaeria bacterium]